MSASFAFAEIVSLLAIWKNHRTEAESKRSENFLLWLEHHRFTELRQQIADSETLQKELRRILERDLNELSKKLDVVLDGVSSISEKLDGFQGLHSSLEGAASELSLQATMILKYFEQSKAHQMVVLDFPLAIGFMPNGKAIEVKEGRSLRSDITELENLSLIEQSSWNSNGDPIYSITRTGIKFAESLEPIELDSLGGPFQ